MFIILTRCMISDMNFVFLFLHLVLSWTCAFSYAQLVSFITSQRWVLWRKDVWFVIMNLLFCFSTCYFCELVHLLTLSWWVTFHCFIILTRCMNNDMNFVILFLHLLLLWTCSVGKLLSTASKCSSLWQDVCLVTRTFFFLFLHLLLLWTCSVGKLLSTTSKCSSLWQDVCSVTLTFLFSFSTCYFCEPAQHVSYFPLLQNVHHCNN